MSKLSIITINYNNGNGLEKTIQSIVSQAEIDYEFIIIDGGSTDNSVDVIKQYADKIKFWASEKDKGIYDAQNKGISKASGDYLLFLNSGDSFFDNNVVAKFYDFLKGSPKKLIYGNSNIINSDGSSSILCPPEKLDLNFWYANTLNHQAVFTHSSLYKKYGNFNTQYKFVSDFEHLFRIYLKEPSEFVYMNQVVCNFDNTGLTSKNEFHKLMIPERKKILQLYVSRAQFYEMRTQYLKTLAFKRKCMVIVTDNPVLKTILKPFYKLFTFFVK